MKRPVAYTLRLDADILAFIRARAATNNRSINGEFVEVLRALREQAAAAPGTPEHPKAPFVRRRLAQ